MAVLHRFHGECSVDSVGTPPGRALKHGAMVQHVLLLPLPLWGCALRFFQVSGILSV